MLSSAGPNSQACRLVADVLIGIAAMPLDSNLHMDEGSRGVVALGGITEQGRRIVEAGGTWSQAVDAMLKRDSKGY